MRATGFGAEIVRRLLQTIPVLFLASVLVFSMLRLIPGNPALIIAGEGAAPQQVALIEHELGIDAPLPVQYLHWIGGVAHGDLGVSFLAGESVAQLLKQRLPATLELSVAAYVFAIVTGIPLGIMAGLAPRSWWDYGMTGFTVFGIGVPDFFLGIALLILFAVHLHWFPIGGRGNFMQDPADAIRRLILPAVSLGVVFAAVLARFVRSSILETMSEDYIRTARAKGLSERAVVMRHALRNSLVPVVTVIGLQVGRLLAGAIVVETVFAWPGIGQLIVTSIQGRDYLVIQSLLLLLVAGFIVVNLVVDLAYAFLDPRIRMR